MRSTRRLTSALLGAALLIASLTPGVMAQSASPAATPSPMCGVLTADEVSGALGVKVAITTSTDSGCDYESDYNAGVYLSLSSRRDTGTLTDFKTAFGAGEAIEVAGQAGVYLPDSFSSLMFIEAPDTGIYTLQMVGSPKEGLDAKAALLSLAALALPRLAAVPAVTQPPAPPAASLTPDKDLEALFPTTVAGLPVTVQSMSGNDLTTNGAAPPALLQALTALGKTMDDLSVAYGYYIDPTTGNGGLISAFQVDGVQMSDLMDVLVPLVLNGETPASQTQTQIGGKDVTVVKLAADTPDNELQYLYPRNDVLWLVKATDPGLTEVFTNLP